MPYIKKSARRALDCGGHPFTCGELNYAITKLVTRYLAGGRHDYAAFNEVIGVLECAKQELYRRVVVPYEECKRAENGDVYE
jgi:hypothetical protein